MTSPSMTPLGRLMREGGGSIDPSKFPAETFELYSIPSFDRGEPEEVPGSTIGSAKQVVEPGDVLLSKIVPHIRRAWVVGRRNGHRQIASGEWIVFRNREIVPTYLRHLLTADFFHRQFMQTVAGVGGSLLRARPQQVARIEIPLPDEDEQERIAAILDKADAIRRKRRQALAEINVLLRATFLDMFGDPATNPKSFDVEPVQRVLSRDRAGTQSGPFGAALKKNELVARGIPVWGIENVEHNSFNPTMRLFITPEKFAELERYDVRDGDVLISRAGTVGRMCIARPPVARSVLSTNLVRVSLDHSKMLPEYFVTLFTSFPDRLSRLRANKKDNAFSFLNPGTLKVLDIPQPGINLQIDFAKRVKAIDRTKQMRLQAIVQADELFGALSQRAFRGEL